MKQIGEPVYQKTFRLRHNKGRVNPGVDLDPGENDRHPCGTGIYCDNAPSSDNPV